MGGICSGSSSVKEDPDQIFLRDVCISLHGTLSNCYPLINNNNYPKDPKPVNSYKFQWPKSGKVKSCNFTFVLRKSSEQSEFKFILGIGTYNSTELSWKPYTDPNSDIIVTAENAATINSYTGEKQEFPGQKKQILINSESDFVKILNLEELGKLVHTAVTSGQQTMTEEEKKDDEKMMKKFEDNEMNKILIAEAASNWASWVQLWTYRPIQQELEKTVFGIKCTELQTTNQTTEQENKECILNAMKTFLEDMNEFNVDKAIQKEKFKTLFESDTVRPLRADYERLVETKFSLTTGNKNTITFQEFKHTRTVFLWDDIPELAKEKEYLTAVFTEYNNFATEIAQQLKSNSQLIFKA